MKYLVCENEKPLIHVSSGQLLSEGRFKHPRRNLDTWVIIICIKGKLYIAQDDRRYTLTENQYIILFARYEHFGFKESEEELSYYWCHFKISDEKYRIMKNDELIHVFDTKTVVLDTSQRENLISRYCVLPEYGDISANGRATLIFRQLLDLARNDHYSDMLPNYALSLLAMEISQEFIEYHFKKDIKQSNPRIEKIIEWIRVNYNRRLTLEVIAKRFLYNPVYISTAFKKYTGLPLMKYVNKVRISNAKRLLLESSYGIKEIAWEVGFEDEKTFLKRFKQQENITPTTYRNAFSRTKIVKK
ncbi:MAG: AraC family transcriptional regulator [Spirochaetaceae bacterium]|jgi:YesN/AraC family two-component response regulator|nr:AraC family transcriptional regulator [Spirochaetaceae bacterium]